MAAVFVRVYNEQPGFGITHDGATAFCKGLVTWINVHSKSEAFCSFSSADGAHAVSFEPCTGPCSAAMLTAAGETIRNLLQFEAAQQLLDNWLGWCGCRG